MIVESTSTSESLLDCVNNGALPLQQLLTILERLVAASDELLTDLTSSSAMDQASSCIVCLDRAHKTSKCLQTSTLEKFKRVLN